MAYVGVWIHAVWSTKNREPFLTDSIRYKIFDHMRQNARAKEIYVDFINGYVDHVHCLISFDADQSISKVIQLLKGESYYWINKNKLSKTKFEWQDDYFVVSVSESVVDKVRTYIKNQEEHHRHKTFTEEYEEFISRYDFK